MLRRKHIVRTMRNSHKSTRSFRTFRHIASSSPSKAKAKSGYLLNAQHGSYQSQYKARKIEMAVRTTTTRGTIAPNVLPNTTLVKPGQIRKEYRAPESDDFSLRISFAKSLERTLMPLLCWIGHVDWRRDLKRESSSPTRVHSHSGYAIGLAMTTYWCFALRLELVLYFWVRPKRRCLSLSFGCDIKFPSVVTWDSETVALALGGDVDGMKIRFGAGAASPFDVLPSGSTLLHVCASPFPQPYSSADLGTARCRAK